ncbi:hypothetical protein CDV31_013162 [Fusarium ambrosium]|uniref:Uncharacterized protein n=1 Tax=Fusarium ambrosium TaxID=131363 RepID=A0A428T547_9HYPO|nr:hypothetical protein CDV31_013162 [Fusarium ambrosium]
MGCRSYSAREMLRLRHAPLQEEMSNLLAAKVEADPDLSEIIRTGAPRPLSLIVEESSAESIEEERRYRRAAAQQLDGTDSERKFRSQTDSEQGRAPLTAPSDLAAQKAEGFQKFFNSVVSPTHVRVTAGGRIVPNTRGPHSPTSKWTRERSPVDGMRQPRVVNGVHPEPIPFPIIPPGWTPFQPLFPGQAPGPIPAGMAFRPDQIPFFPAPIGFAGVPYNQISPPNHVPQPNMSATFGKQNEIHTLHQPKPIQLSPAEQFDASRPFFFNNQWMIAYGNHAQPVGLMPPFPINTAPIPMQPQQAPTQPQPASHPKGDANPQTAGREQGTGPARTTRRRRQWAPPPGLHSHTSVGSSTKLPLSPKSPRPPGTHKSSILASNITKSHLKILRAKKRQVEDQLQFNIHQIDRKEMESKLKEICDEIDRMTFMHERQIQGETGTLPLFQTPIDLPAYYAQSDAGSNSLAAARPGTRADDGSIPSRSPGYKPGVTVTPVEDSALGGQAPQRKSSSLPVNAALAPPFQPRAETNNSSMTTAAPDEPVLMTHLPQPPRGSAFKSFFNRPVDRNNYGVPYLIGRLPYNLEPQDALDTDRRYIRELNQHELHAIHMYRQRVHPHDQTGVVFDGVNFYYPHHDLEGTASPQSSPENPQDSQPPASTGENESLNDPFNAMAQAGTSAIRNRLDEATRSESLHRAEDSLRGSSTSELPRSESYVSQPSPRYLEFRRRVNEKTRISSENLRTKPSEDSGDEDGNLLFKGRRVMERSVSTKHPNEIWSSMRRRGKASANAVAGQVSPMTAQGVLPHYSGHATASLTPAIANTASNSRGAGAKLGETYTIPSTNTAAEKRGENKPPMNPLGQQLRSVSLHDKKHIGLSTPSLP